MTFQEFIEKFNGKYIDFDGVYGAQCVDLIRYYIVEVLGISNNTIKPVAGAKDMFEKYDTLVDKNVFERIPNTPTGVAEESDIVLWGATSGNPYGHVALFVEGDTNSFRSFDQNFPVGSPCHIQNHSYSNVLGWLHFKKQLFTTNEALDECKLQLADEIKKKNETHQELQEVEDDLRAANSSIQSYQEFQRQLAITLKTDVDTAKILGEIEKLLSKEDQLNQFQRDNADLRTQVENITNMLQEKTDLWIDTQKENQALQEEIQGLTRDNNELSTKVKELMKFQTVTFKRLFWNIYYGEVIEK